MIYDNLPGVYTNINIESGEKIKKTKSVLIIAPANTSANNEIKKINSMAECIEIYGIDDDKLGSVMSHVCRMLFDMGVENLYAAAIDNGQTYQNVNTIIDKIRMFDGDIDIVASCVCSKLNSENFVNMINERNDSGKRTFGIIHEYKSSLSALCNIAKSINNERIIFLSQKIKCGLTADSGFDVCLTPAAVAGIMAVWEDPSVPFDFQKLPDMFYEVKNKFSNSELDALLGSGATVFRTKDGSVELVRLVTTKTVINDVEDHSLLDVNTVLISDDVMRSVSDMLRSKFYQAKNNAATRRAIISQIAVVLEGKKAAGYIEDYASPRVKADEQDPTRCIAEISFAAAAGLHSIVINSNIKI